MTWWPGFSSENKCSSPDFSPDQENKTIPPWFPSFERNSQVPEEHRTANWEVGIPTACSWNYSKFRSWLEISTTGTARFTRGGRVICSRLVWWCEFMRYSRKKGYDHGTRFTACSQDSRRQAFLIGCDIFCPSSQLYWETARSIQHTFPARCTHSLAFSHAANYETKLSQKEARFLKLKC